MRKINMKRKQQSGKQNEQNLKNSFDRERKKSKQTKKSEKPGKQICVKTRIKNEIIRRIEKTNFKSHTAKREATVVNGHLTEKPASRGCPRGTG